MFLKRMYLFVKQEINWIKNVKKFQHKNRHIFFCSANMLSLHNLPILFQWQTKDLFNTIFENVPRKMDPRGRVWMCGCMFIESFRYK